MDCFGRTSLVTVMNTDARLRALLANLAGSKNDASVILVSDVLDLRSGRSSTVGRGRDPGRRKPQFNYEPFNSNSVNIRSWSWNYRGCWHQTCPPIVTRCWMVLNIPH